MTVAGLIHSRHNANAAYGNAPGVGITEGAETVTNGREWPRYEG